MKQLSILFLAVPLLLFSCSKEGPAGPQGAQGEQGPQGGAGPQGPQGPAGNANVKVYEKDIATMTWTASGTYSYLSVPAPKVLTASVLENSTILVYVYTSDFSGWGMVPYHTERNIRVTAEVKVGSVLLRKDQNGTPTTQSWHHRIRLVIIANTGTAAALNRQAYTDASFNDYPAAKVQALQ
ncbi:hypothetical protein [Chitinophaga cymbidii]|uniref:Collagen-like protein n=1 Tax=Chitinophaga cymbidii TaxID=1096750 RepID=A0A512RN12_9BACT|nr:hypothetical protein [Chitinophaga cymbidii]GEP97087.1 hypothetical protein CCY01nite_33470 [Chitinophaga cymbidii]